MFPCWKGACYGTVSYHPLQRRASEVTKKAMVFLTLFCIPLLLILANMILGRNKVTFKEFLLQMGIQACIAGVSCAVVYYSNTSDVEIHNGRVASKSREKVSCSHSYRCNCHDVCTGSGKDEHCTEHCDTCYEHSYDVDWPVVTTNGEQMEIDRVDRQGVSEPPRWTSVVVGEPTALQHSYTNYIKASPDTLFRQQGLVEQYKTQLPEYPGGVYDYYRLDRLVQVGTNVLDAPLWNRDLSELNGDLGRLKEVNAVVVLVDNKPREYFSALEQHWMGGKKNDVVLVISLSSSTIQWADVLAWTDYPLFKVKLRDDVLEVGTLLREPILKAMYKNIQTHFVRKSMKDFEYLQASITPTTGQWIGALIFGIIACIATSFFVVNNDVFGEEGYRFYR